MTATNYSIDSKAAVADAMRVLDESAQKLVVVVTDEKVVGVVSDGDIRRAYLKHRTLDLPLEVVMNKHPRLFALNMTEQEMLQIMRESKVHHVPLVDERGHLVRIVHLADLLGWDQSYSNPVVLMAGGFGTRLRPLTESTPKPLIQVGGRPILETIISHFKYHGFHRFHISIHYLGHMIEEHFGDGEKLGVEISYIRETEPLGTAGALSLVADELNEPFFVMNGDLLTNLNTAQMMDFHLASHAPISVAVYEHEYQIPFGVVELEGDTMIGLVEKPYQSALVSAGVYVLSPEVLDLVPHDSYCDMPKLIDTCIARDTHPRVYPLTERWLDVGRNTDLDRAADHYDAVFGHLTDDGHIR